MEKKRSRREHHQISRQVFTRYLRFLIGTLLALCGMYVMAAFLCSSVVWYEDDWLYRALKMLQALAPFVMLIAAIGCGILFTRQAIRRPLQYLDEVIDAAKSLSAPGEEPIALSQELIFVQNELNLAREQSLRNARAAKEAEQRKNDLVVYLAHDLKTPLTSVIGYLTLLREEPQLSPEMRERFAGAALEKAERLEGLINEFFEITRFNLSVMTLELSRVNLSRMLEQVAFEFGPVLAEKELGWKLQLQPGLHILGDPDKLARVFDNLIRNAVSYGSPGSEVELALQLLGEQVEISLKNHGRTIAEDKLERIFEQFFRLDSARRSSTGGAGLGLAIARQIVERHGGSIWAKSADDKVVFTVRLPVGGKKG